MCDKALLPLYGWFIEFIKEGGVEIIIGAGGLGDLISDQGKEKVTVVLSVKQIFIIRIREM